ncbi:23S rRNA pseudouridine(2604) synthase RluF [Romboutsia lituseburensis]|uniref:Pseudouridine synthase n=1 Tax=Romboutsia lituseburensis DSM 797 TaxID=1121325 RepID=A0A1G9MZQ7_9FIRM|nr:23S rRNA pseudouridine(2604) synthase RluF [Romboutsia lituseburensis]CEH34254.1 Ribosomal large subunit pseudouridine synthase F [Romboutsia lituseburensis]SDL79633.1 ribosomal large subunit pseudouridine synthase F [Romboutsia lituseburensis DSM 797]
MRLNNYISSTGMCSRREADKLIQQRKVLINGKIAQIGQAVEPNDVVKVNGRKITPKKQHVYIALNKPVGITCTTERHIKDNIIDYINYPERIFPVGRLDKPSEGLIILTSDGTIVNKILRSENNHEKEYVVTVDKNITDKFISDMQNGVRIFNPVNNKYVITNKCKVTKVNNKTFKIILSQGLNRQIRRMCEVFGYNVTKLQRIRIMNLTVKGIAPGKWRKLTDKEVQSLIK